LLGVVIAFIGFLMIALSSSSDGSGFFFVFPFFVFGDISGSFMIVVVASVVLMLVLFFYFPLRGLSQGWEEFSQNEARQYVRIISQCEFCSKPIPEGSTFCPSCGSPLREDSSDRYEPMY
jgi:hypothetical protein